MRGRTIPGNAGFMNQSEGAVFFTLLLTRKTEWKQRML